MAEIINLRRARKAADRKAKSAQAEENRVQHGRSKSEKKAQSRNYTKLADHLDGHRLSGVRPSDAKD